MPTFQEEWASDKAKFGGLALATVEGFSDELRKIAATSPEDIINLAIKKKPSSMFAKPKMTARPNFKDAEPPSSVLDHFSSSKSMQPPPVTMATAPGT